MNHSDEQRADVFAGRAAQLLHEQADGLDAPTRSRLNRARQQALDELDAQRSSPLRNKFWAPAGGLVLASVAGAMLWMSGLQMSGQTPSPAITEVDPADMLLVDQDFEMLEDVEFYNWLQSVPGGTA